MKESILEKRCAMEEYDRIEVLEDRIYPAVIKVIGIGGAGCNAVNNMAQHGLRGVELIAVNTDVQSLHRCFEGIRRVQIGEKVTKGLGAGGNPEIGKRAAMEDEAKLISILEGADMVFIACGMGGGTGTGAGPIVARLAKEMGILTVGVVTKPFSFEAKKRWRNAYNGIREMSEFVDAFIVISNDKLRTILGDKVTVLEAFKAADDILRQAVQGITDIINSQGYVNADFNDVRMIMENKGMAVMAIAEAEGEDRANIVVEKALNNPLVESGSIRGARGVLFNITADESFTLEELDIVTERLREEAAYDGDEDVDVIFGFVVDTEWKNKVRLTVIAVGFDEARQSAMEPALSSKSIKAEYVKRAVQEDIKAKSKTEEVEEEKTILDVKISPIFKKFR
ncbi:MAG: cell division protein FtsZ [Thermosulfidibacteraceae bacterium]